MTIEKLIELLSKYPKNFKVIDEQNRDFIHMINDGDKDNEYLRLSPTKPIGLCNRTGGYVYPSIVPGYIAFCPELDEDLYEIEFTRDMSCMRETED
jgi:hypothetical protein